MELLTAFRNNPIAITFLIIVLGSIIGRLKVAGLTLGSSGVLFAALLFGHLDWVPPGDALKWLGQFGVVLFVYAIGLQAGPRFVATVRSKGVAPLAVGLATVLGAAILAAGVGWLLEIDPAMAVGVFAGALTSTPALAAAQEASDSPLVSVAYGVAYPFGIIGVVLFAQLLPRWLARQREPATRAADATPMPQILKRTYRVENPAAAGKTLASLNLHAMVTANISRVLRGETVMPYSSDLRLEHGDIVLAVGSADELKRLELIFGPPVEVQIDRDPSVVARDIYITEPTFSGRSLRELQVLQKYGVVITRVRREGLEFVPQATFVLEVGDQVRAVGHDAEIQAFARLAGIREQRIHETGIPAFAAGLVAGLLLGMIPLPLPGGADVTLGLAGGPLFVGLMLGHFGRIGRFRVHVPSAGRYLMRELGLVLFLVYAGTSAGAELVATIQSHGVTLAVLAVITVLYGLLVGWLMSYVLFKQSAASTVGLTCGAMTSTPGLGAASAQFDTDAPALAYAAVYPLALVTMTVAAQLLVGVLNALQ